MEHALDPESLLDHGDFVRAVARSLLHDEHLAEDVAQETWITALRRPPAEGRSLRAWLAGIARNLARGKLREEHRRRRREVAAADPLPPRPTDEIVEREALRRRVVEAVLDLKDPYRSALLYRFFDGMKPREMARDLNIPLNTVRTHIERGLAQVKMCLDRAHGGSRKAWCLALLPIAGMKTLGGTAGAATVSASLATGVLTMSIKTKFLVTAMVLPLVITGGYLLFMSSIDEQEETEPGYGNIDTVPGAETADGRESPNPGIGVKTQTGPGGEDYERTALVSEGTYIAGRVIDLLTGEPVEAFDFLLYSSAESGSDLGIHETVRNEDGRFRFPLKQGGEYSIMFGSSRHKEKTVFGLDVPDQGGLEDVQVALDPGLSIMGRVEDAQTGRPVPDALVTTDVGSPNAHLLFEGHDEITPNTRTDAEGRFTLSGLEDVLQRITAIHPEYAQGFKWASVGEDPEVRILIGRGHRIRGTVLDDEGEPLPDVKVSLHGDGIPVARHYRSSADGLFSTDRIAPGRVWLACEIPRWEQIECRRFTPEIRIIRMEDRDIRISIGGPEAGHVTWRGTVLNAGGRPLPRCYIRISPTWKTNPLRHDTFRNFMSRSATCDEKGCFELRKLHVGTNAIDIDWEETSGSKSIRWGEITFTAPGLHLDDLRIHESNLRGWVVDGGTGKPIRGMKGKVEARDENGDFMETFEAGIDENGRFHLSGLPPGSYKVTAHVKDFSKGWIEGLEVKRGQALDDVRIPLPRQGTIEIHLSGMNAKDDRRIQYRFRRKDERFYFPGATSTGAGKNGSQTIRKHLPIGTWVFYLSYPARDGLRYLERTFEIQPDTVTVLRIRTDELPFRRDKIRMTGTLLGPKGKPEADARLRFECSWLGISKSDVGDTVVLEAACDHYGAFVADGLEPGHWSVDAKLADGNQVECPVLVVPANGPAELTRDIQLPGGMLTGAFETGTEHPMTGGHPLRFMVALFEGNNDATTRARLSGAGASRFTLRGISSGRYRLKVWVEGFREYLSPRFFIEENGKLDLGRIPLEPGGCVDLELVDSRGKGIPWFRFLAGKEGVMRKAEGKIPLEDGRVLITGLPLGQFNVRIESRGFRAKEMELFLATQTTRKIRVVLEKE